MIVLGKTYKTEEEFLEEHIIFPKTKDINYLKMYSNMGYKLYVKHENYLRNLEIRPEKSLCKDTLLIVPLFIYYRTYVSLEDIFCISIDEANSLIAKFDYVPTIYFIYD